MELVIGDIIRRQGDRIPEKLCQVFGKDRFSFREVNLLANKFANSLLKAGYARGDHIGIFSRNCIEYVISFWAAAKIGIVLVHFNARLTDRDLAGLIDHSDVKLLIFDAQLGQAVEKTRNLVRCANSLRFLGIGNFNGTWADNFSQFLENGEREEPLVEITSLVQENDPFAMLYTSGTEGFPKGVLISHKQRFMLGLQTALVSLRGLSIRLLNVMPFFHMVGQNLLSTMALLGAPTFQLRRFDPEEFIETIDCEKINYTILVPTMIEQLLNSHSLSDSDLSSLEVIGYGTAPTRSATRRRMRDELPHVRFVQGFGQTEAGVPVYFEDREEDITPGYIGPPNVLSDVKIIRDNGEVARPGEIGEIVFRTPALMLGYYKNTEATDRFFDQGREWGRTGDLGFVDEYSHVTITGRMKDMYISGGENVYPVEIEQVLLRHPSISEAVVFGVPDETWGEVGCACVIRKANEQLSEEDILAYCRKHLGKFKCPKYVNFYDSFPRNALGKVVKGALTPDFSAFLE